MTYLGEQLPTSSSLVQVNYLTHSALCRPGMSRPRTAAATMPLKSTYFQGNVDEYGRWLRLLAIVVGWNEQKSDSHCFQSGPCGHGEQLREGRSDPPRTPARAVVPDTKSEQNPTTSISRQSWRKVTPLWGTKGSSAERSIYLAALLLH